MAPGSNLCVYVSEQYSVRLATSEGVVTTLACAATVGYVDGASQDSPMSRWIVTENRELFRRRIEGHDSDSLCKHPESNPAANPRGSVNQRARESERVALGLREQPPRLLSDPEMSGSEPRPIPILERRIRRPHDSKNSAIRRAARVGRPRLTPVLEHRRSACRGRGPRDPRSRPVPVRAKHRGRPGLRGSRLADPRTRHQRGGPSDRSTQLPAMQ